jgi:hypothetical protein
LGGIKSMQIEALQLKTFPELSVVFDQRSCQFEQMYTRLKLDIVAVTSTQAVTSKLSNFMSIVQALLQIRILQKLRAKKKKGTK